MTAPTYSWTAETEELVARALPQIPSWCPDPQCGDSTWDHECELGGERPYTALAQKVLTALADAGVLTPPGGETRQEWAVRVDEPHPKRSERAGDLMTHLGEQKSRRCREWWQGWTPMHRTVTTWPDSTELTTPWREVTDDPA